VSAARKLAHRAEVVKGAAMKTIGRLTGNRRLRARGRRDQAKGNIKQYGAKIKDTLKRLPPGAVRGPMTFTLVLVANLILTARFPRRRP
jgi:uncharacterized protein YjbJ (UPF0337 family)